MSTANVAIEDDTAGLVSGYQLTEITSSGIAVIQDTGNTWIRVSAPIDLVRALPDHRVVASDAAVRSSLELRT